VDTRAEFAFHRPPGSALDQAGPERVGAALGWFGGMNRTSLGGKESALVLTSGQLTQAEHVPITDCMPGFELGGGQA
jgi:hypothetical protein